MQSSPDALRCNMLSNWFVTSSLLKVDASSKQLHQAPVFGKDSDVIY